MKLPQRGGGGPSFSCQYAPSQVREGAGTRRGTSLHPRRPSRLSGSGRTELLAHPTVAWFTSYQGFHQPQLGKRAHAQMSNAHPDPSLTQSWGRNTGPHFTSAPLKSNCTKLDHLKCPTRLAFPFSKEFKGFIPSSDFTNHWRVYSALRTNKSQECTQ